MYGTIRSTVSPTTVSRNSTIVAANVGRNVGRSAPKIPNHTHRRPRRRYASSGRDHYEYRPYSGSLPSPGHEWCSRCNIPLRSFQVAIGTRHPCLDLPPVATFRWLGLHLCAPARRYYRNQLTTMAFLVTLCFVVLPQTPPPPQPPAENIELVSSQHR